MRSSAAKPREVRPDKPAPRKPAAGVPLAQRLPGSARQPGAKPAPATAGERRAAQEREQARSRLLRANPDAAPRPGPRQSAAAPATIAERLASQKGAVRNKARQTRARQTRALANQPTSISPRAWETRQQRAAEAQQLARQRQATSLPKKGRGTAATPAANAQRAADATLQALRRQNPAPQAKQNPHIGLRALEVRQEIERAAAPARAEADRLAKLRDAGATGSPRAWETTRRRAQEAETEARRLERLRDLAAKTAPRPAPAPPPPPPPPSSLAQWEDAIEAGVAEHLAGARQWAEDEVNREKNDPNKAADPATLARRGAAGALRAAHDGAQALLGAWDTLDRSAEGDLQAQRELEQGAADVANGVAGTVNDVVTDPQGSADRAVEGVQQAVEDFKEAPAASTGAAIAELLNPGKVTKPFRAAGGDADAPSPSRSGGNSSRSGTGQAGGTPGGGTPNTGRPREDAARPRGSGNNTAPPTTPRAADRNAPPASRPTDRPSRDADDDVTAPRSRPGAVGDPAKPRTQPERRTTEPERRTTQPDRRASEPDRRTPKPERRAPEPDSRTPKPERRAPEPDRRAPEPERRSPDRERPETPRTSPDRDKPDAPDTTPREPDTTGTKAPGKPEAPRRPGGPPDREAPSTQEGEPRFEDPANPDSLPDPEAPDLPRKAPGGDNPITPEKPARQEATPKQSDESGRAPERQSPEMQTGRADDRASERDGETEAAPDRQRVDLPGAPEYRRAWTSIDNFRSYMLNVADPEVRARFESEFADRIRELQSGQAEKYKKLWKELFPHKADERTPPQAGNRAEEVIRGFTADADELMNDLSDFAARTGRPALADGNLARTLDREGAAAWEKSFRETQAKIDEVLSGFTYHGREIGYIGSMRTGLRGPHKGKTRFDPYDFDVDLYVVVDKKTFEKVRAEHPHLDSDDSKIMPDDTEPEDLVRLGKQIGRALKEKFPHVRGIEDSTIALRAEEPW
ncbi:hypothetical protein [Lentzea xinjiangensis]|uniref:hypothetical protein n=1 Tax=Lentzea xinjiangensis TaxID=402600 RepID=UPI0011606E0C|nr:hypothetical protein [Lentzea xinjiangensis]